MGAKPNNRQRHPKPPLVYPAPVESPCPCPHLLWEYSEDIRLRPSFPVIAAKITQFGDLNDIRWLVQSYGRHAIKDWLENSLVIGADRRSVALMCLVSGASIDHVAVAPDWVL